jgi:hypothetical protein
MRRGDGISREYNVLILIDKVSKVVKSFYIELKQIESIVKKGIFFTKRVVVQPYPLVKWHGSNKIV